MAASLLALTILFYVFVYTIWLKRKTPQNIVIGGAAGALPPVIGWSIATGGVSIEPIILFLLISIEPVVGLSINDSKFNKVDFPDPDGPIIEYIFPDSKLKEISSKTFIDLFFSYFFVKFFIFILFIFKSFNCI